MSLSISVGYVITDSGLPLFGFIDDVVFAGGGQGSIFK
jgi:hypothetical protein